MKATIFSLALWLLLTVVVVSCDPVLHPVFVIKGPTPTPVCADNACDGQMTSMEMLDCGNGDFKSKQCLYDANSNSCLLQFPPCVAPVPVPATPAADPTSSTPVPAPLEDGCASVLCPSNTYCINGHCSTTAPPPLHGIERISTIQIHQIAGFEPVCIPQNCANEITTMEAKACPTADGQTITWTRQCMFSHVTNSCKLLWPPCPATGNTQQTPAGPQNGQLCPPNACTDPVQVSTCADGTQLAQQCIYNSAANACALQFPGCPNTNTNNNNMDNNNNNNPNNTPDEISIPLDCEEQCKATLSVIRLRPCSEGTTTDFSYKCIFSPSTNKCQPKFNECKPIPPASQQPPMVLPPTVTPPADCETQCRNSFVSNSLNCPNGFPMESYHCLFHPDTNTCTPQTNECPTANHVIPFVPCKRADCQAQPTSNDFKVHNGATFPQECQFGQISLKCEWRWPTFGDDPVPKPADTPAPAQPTVDPAPANTNTNNNDNSNNNQAAPASAISMPDATPSSTPSSNPVKAVLPMIIKSGFRCRGPSDVNADMALLPCPDIITKPQLREAQVQQEVHQEGTDTGSSNGVFAFAGLNQAQSIGVIVGSFFAGMLLFLIIALAVRRYRSDTKASEIPTGVPAAGQTPYALKVV